MKRKSSAAWALLTFLVAATVPVAAELPDSELNPHTGYIESVDAPYSTGYKVRHVEDEGQGGSRTSTTLSDHAAVGPRIAIRTNGDSWVTWWRDTTTDQVYVRSHDESAGTWSPQKAISNPSEVSRYPEIIQDGSSVTWIAYQVDLAAGTDIAVWRIIDSADPWPSRELVGSSNSTGDRDVKIHAESGEVWVTWVDDSSYVAWIQYDDVSETWSSVAYESYVGSDVATARADIRDDVLGL